jgi:hypothetical protein
MGLRSWLVLGALSAVGCGGKAIVDGFTDTGSGGSGGEGAGSSGICGTPEPEGQPYECAASPQGDGCYRDRCDPAANRWRATCTETGCSCTFNNGQVQCSCVGGDLTSFCDGTGPSCCPTPFP